MRQTIRKIINKFGYEITKNKKEVEVLPSRKTSSLTFYQTLTGNYYLPTHAYEDIVANTIKNNQVFEKEVVDMAYKYIKEGTVVLDVGSNFGQMSILFSNKVGPRGTVYAFDADDFIFEILKKNISANNKDGKIIPTFGAVHNKENEILFFPEQNFERFSAYGSYGIDYNSTEGRKVRSITIDSLMIEDPISFMKIDIQGGDLQAMQGAVKTIEKNKMPILFEYEYHFEDDYNLKFQDYVDFIRDIDYEFKKVINGHNYLVVPKG